MNCFYYRLIEKVKGIKIGNSLGADMIGYEGAVMGPVVSRDQYNKIWNFIEEAKASDIPLLYGGDKSLVEVSFYLHSMICLDLICCFILIEFGFWLFYSTNNIY